MDQYRYRLTFSKGRPVKYVAHLDTVLTWTRAFRRAQIPLAYSQGFNPQARIQVAASLPVGYMGRSELMDIYLNEALRPTDILDKVAPTLPPGFRLSNVVEVALKSPAMQQQLIRADYQVTVETDWPEATLQERVDTLMAADEVIQTRIRRKKKETYNLRLWLHEISIDRVSNDDVLFFMHVSAGQHGNLRPEAVLQALGLADTWFEIERTKLIFDS